MALTQKQTVLNMLKAAGSFGVRSDTYIKDYMPRAAARIQELKDEGYNITSEREGKYTRWTLVGSRGAGTEKAPSGAPASSEAARIASQLTPGAPGEPGTSRSVPSFFDSDADWSDAA